MKQREVAEVTVILPVWSVHSILLVTQNSIRNTILIVHKGVGKPGGSTWTTSYPLRWIVKQRDKQVVLYVGTTGMLDFPSCWGSLPFSCPVGFSP
jgi:hypothetical protein